MKLYHVSTNLDNLPMVFKPRIPSCVMKGEDKVIPRICFSSDIKKALLSMPDSYEGLFNKYYMQIEKGIPALFSLFETTIEELGMEFIKTPKELTNQGLVPDAQLYEEYWVLKPLRKKPSSIVWVESMKKDVETDIVEELQIQFSVENEKRIFSFTLIYEEEYLKLKELVNQLNIPFQEDIKKGYFDFGEGKFELTVFIKEGIDVSPLWLSYYSMRFQYENELGTEDFDQLLKYSSPFFRKEG